MNRRPNDKNQCPDHDTEQAVSPPSFRPMSAAEANRKIVSGWGAADLHVHTWCSHDVMPLRHLDPLVLYAKARRRGFRFVAFTDHDTMDAYDRVGWTRPGIVPSVELKILDRVRVGHTLHINVYGLTRDQFTDLREIVTAEPHIERLVEYLRRAGLAFVYNHPFWHEPWETPDIQSIIDVASLFPVLEYNSGRVKALNLLALALAEKHRSRVVAGSDTHVGEIGRAFTVAPGEDFDGFFAAVRRGVAGVTGEDMTASRMTQEVVHRIHYLFDKRDWRFEKPSYAIETGNRLLDGLVRRRAAHTGASRRWLIRWLGLALRAIVQSGIPAALYINSQKMLALKIQQTASLTGRPGLPPQPVLEA